MTTSLGEIEILARGVMVRRGMLLVCHSRRKKNYFLPGGHVDLGERAKAALAREIEEEIGLPCSVGRFLGATEHAYLYRRERIFEVNLLFVMRVRGLTVSRPVPSREPKLEFLWLPLSKLLESKLEPFSLREDLPRWLKNLTSDRWSSTL
ncbi:MAG: NUDIX domain-containing protein [Verrucomicrobiota bacterium]